MKLLRILGRASRQSRRRRWFSGHYDEWRAKRLAYIIGHFGADFFLGKMVLELGCGYADMGSVFRNLGAFVTACDGRAEHLHIARRRHPSINFVRCDLDHEWPEGEYDVILHLGVLYHLNDFRRTIGLCARSCKQFVLETEVCDSDDPECVTETVEEGYDQALNRCGVRPSGAAIEKCLKENQAAFVRCDDLSLNSGYHQYNWTVQNTRAWKPGLRRFWFVNNENNPQAAAGLKV